MLRTARLVIVDEIHAVIETRRGAHLALSLERLDHVAGRRLQRVGLSAAQGRSEGVGEWRAGETQRRKGAKTEGEAQPAGQPPCVVASLRPCVIDEGHKRT